MLPVIIGEVEYFPAAGGGAYLFYLLLRQMAARHTVIQTRHSYTKIKKT